ncbi:MAG: MFS transporter [Actinobacteria bacterium]|nr:MAG: MFS transporter [Actinomycetota bacterium]REK37202.1 MAG: MFS transporter [Actinomycetota bacterium]
MPTRLRRLLEPLLPVGRFDSQARRFVAVMWLAGLLQGFAQSQATATLPFTRVGLGLSEGEMSLLLGFARLAAFGALPIGWLGDHIGRRRPFLWALTLVLVGGTLAGLVVDAWQFGMAQALLRVGTAAVSGLSVVIIAERVPSDIRAYSISFYGAAVSLGAGIALMTLPLADGGGEAWRIPHLLIAVGVLAMPLLIKKVPESELFERSPHDGHWRELVSGPHSRVFWVVGLVGFLASAFSSVALAFSTERLIEGVGLTTGDTVLVSLVGGTFGGIGFFVGGHLADSWGRRLTTVLSLLLALSGGIVLYNTASVPLIVGAVVVSSFGTFAFVPAGGSHRAELFPTRLRSSATTAAANLAIVGSATGLISGIFTIERFGLSRSVTFLGIGMLVAAGLTLTLPETKGQDLSAPITDRR